MSVHVLSWVLKHSEETLGRRLVLIVLADHAKEDGSGSWPSVETIAREARLSERQVQYALRGLESSLSITCTGQTKKGTRVYAVNMKGADIAPLAAKGGAIYDTEGVHSIAPEPSLEPSKTSMREINGRNAVWDALVEVFGEPSTDTARSLRGKVCSSLTRAGATSDEVVARAKSWPRHFENATLTELALEKHWDALGRKPLRMERR